MLKHCFELSVSTVIAICHCCIYITFVKTAEWGGGGRRIISTLAVFSVCVRVEQRRAVIVNTHYILERTDPRHNHLWKVR